MKWVTHMPRGLPISGSVLAAVAIAGAQAQSPNAGAIGAEDLARVHLSAS